MTKLMCTAVLSLYSYTTLAAPRVLISGFDPFGRSSTNPSWEIAQKVAQSLTERGVESTSCLLPTSYQRSLPALEKCHEDFGPADLVISLGAGLCNVKWETRTFNKNHDRGPDNDGVSRRRQTIIDNGPKELGLRLNFQKMWCSLSQAEKNITMISTNPDTFVCNHLAYQYSLKNPSQLYGFIHVPSEQCLKKSPALLDQSVALVSKMIQQQLSASSESRLEWPDFSNDTRLLTSKKEVKSLLQESDLACEQEFIKKWSQAF